MALYRLSWIISVINSSLETVRHQQLDIFVKGHFFTYLPVDDTGGGVFLNQSGEELDSGGEHVSSLLSHGDTTALDS